MRIQRQNLGLRDFSEQALKKMSSVYASLHSLVSWFQLDYGTVCLFKQR